MPHSVDRHVDIVKKAAVESGVEWREVCYRPFLSEFVMVLAAKRDCKRPPQFGSFSDLVNRNNDVTPSDKSEQNRAERQVSSSFSFCALLFSPPLLTSFFQYVTSTRKLCLREEEYACTVRP